MARLVVASGKLRNEVIELNLGVNRICRGPANDFQLDDSTISTQHCEVILGGDGIMVRDKDSTMERSLTASAFGRRGSKPGRL